MTQEIEEFLGSDDPIDSDGDIWDDIILQMGALDEEDISDDEEDLIWDHGQ